MKLRPYQERALEFWIENPKTYFAIDMGLGKTPISLHALNYFNVPALIVAPLTVAFNTWPEEIKAWDLQDDLPYTILHGKNKQLDNNLIHIINYEGLGWLYKELYKLHKAKIPIPYKALILDESTFVKSPHADRFGLLCAMREMFQYVALLSGTPAPNSLEDLWAQYFILDGGKVLGNDYRVFRNRFFEQDPYRKYQWNIRFGAEAFIHKAIAPITFRLAASDYADLPERVFNTINLDFQPAQKKQYESFREDFVLFLETATIESLNQASLSSKLRQYVQGFVYHTDEFGRRTPHYVHDIKINALKYFLEANVGKSVLCFTQFKSEIDMILKEFPGTPVIDSRTNIETKNQYIRDWNAKKIPLLLAHPKSVSRGLNLQHGGHVALWYALTWSLEDYLQANKRLHRSGQEEVVFIHHLIIRGTMDEKVYAALQDKDMTQQRLLEYLRKETMRYAA